MDTPGKTEADRDTQGGGAIIVPTAISPIEFTRQSMWRTLVLGTFVCKWIQGQITTKSYQGLQSCLVCAEFNNATMDNKKC